MESIGTGGRKRILVLGGTGFLGSNLCRHLGNRGYEVTCFGLSYPEQRWKNVGYCKGDFFEDEDLRRVIQDKECIIHAISTLHPGNSNEKYMSGYEKDFIQTIKLCDMLVGKPVKMIFISSGGTVYGNHIKQPIREETLPCPINHYGNIKLGMENTMRTFNYQMGTRFIIARVSNPYGPGQDFHKGVGFIDASLKNTLNGRPVEIWGDGENVRDYVYVDDFCEMMECLVEYQGERDTFNLCSGIGVSQNRIIEIIRQMGLSPDVVYMRKRSVDVRKIILSSQRIREIWGKRPVRVEQGMELYRKYLEGNSIYSLRK